MRAAKKGVPKAQLESARMKQSRLVGGGTSAKEGGSVNEPENGLDGEAEGTQQDSKEADWTCRLTLAQSSGPKSRSRIRNHPPHYHAHRTTP